MAKFCGHCGAQLEDTAKVCGKCGTPLEDTSAGIPNLKIKDPEKEAKTKKAVKSVLVIGVLAIAAVIVVNVVSQFTGYNGLLRKVMTAYEKYDIDTLISVSSDMYYYGVEDWVANYFEYSVGDDLDFFELAVGHNYKLSYEVKETYTLSGRRLDEMLKRIENTYADFDTDTIDKIVVADLTVTAKQGSKSTSREVSIVMSKEDGTWRLIYID